MKENIIIIMEIYTQVNGLKTRRKAKVSFKIFLKEPNLEEILKIIWKMGKEISIRVIRSLNKEYMKTTS